MTDHSRDKRTAGVNAPTLARSTLYIQTAQVWEVASRVILTPVVISNIGLEGYGTWTLLFSLCAYVMGLNASFGFAYEKLTAELDRKQEYTRLREVVGSGMALIGSVATLALTAIWMLHSRILPALGVDPSLAGDAARALLVLMLATTLNVTLGCLLQVLGGLQRMDLRYGVEVAGSMANFVTALACLYGGKGLIALPLGYLAEQVVAVAGAWILCARLRPALMLSPFRVSMAGLREIVSLGMRFQGVMLLGTVVRQGIRTAIAGLCGTAALGTFHLADRLLFVARRPAAAILTPLLPAFTNLAAGSEPERWRKLFAQSSKALALAGTVPLLFVALFADPVLFAWTGRRYPEAAWTARVLATADFASLLTAVATVGLRAAGTVRLELIFGLVNAALIVLGLAIGYPLAGYAGIVVAVTGARMVSTFGFLERFAAFSELPLWEHVKTNLLWPAAAVAPAVGVVAAMGFSLPLLRAHDATRAPVLLTLLLLAGGCALMCGLVIWLFVLAPAERQLLRRLLPRRRR